jgi:hypothetical protein
LIRSKIMRSPNVLSQRLLTTLLITTTGGAALSGCGEQVTERVVPDLDCGKHRDNAVTVEFPDLRPGENVNMGHPRASDDGLAADVRVTINSDGNIEARPTSDTLGAPDVKISPLQGGIQVVAGNESYSVTSVPGRDTGSYNLTVSGQCVKS